MAGLQWIRLDTAMFDHPKFLYLIEDGHYRAIVLHIRAMCYSATYDLAGFLPEVALRMLGGCSGDAQTMLSECLDDAKTLLDACLWAPAQGGWQINSWQEYQSASDAAEKRSEKAKNAAQVRWAKRNGVAHDPF